MDGDMVSVANYAMFFHQRGQDGNQEARAQIEASAKVKSLPNARGILARAPAQIPSRLAPMFLFHDGRRGVLASDCRG
jgi:hypothetical protein